MCVTRYPIRCYYRQEIDERKSFVWEFVLYTSNKYVRTIAQNTAVACT